ncbi:MAG: dihydrofolate reductase [Hyphomicrobium sp.]
MHISIVVAVAENGVIGRDGGLPWRIPPTSRTFRRITMGKAADHGAAHVPIAEEAARRARQHCRHGQSRLPAGRRPHGSGF